MVEQQLIDYIKKAKAVGQSSEQTQALLYKNGWSADEVSQAFAAAEQLEVQQPTSNPAPVQQGITQPNPQAQSQPQQEHQISGRPEINLQRSREPAQIKPIQEQKTTYNVSQEQKPVYNTSDFKQMRSGNNEMAGLALKLTIAFVLLGVIAVGGYFAISQTDFLKKADTPEVVNTENQTPAGNMEPIVNPVEPSKPQSKNLAVIPAEYDVSKISASQFQLSGNMVVYCAPLKTNQTSFACFSNNRKLFDIPYQIKPYWIGMSPDGQRTVLLFYDYFKKQSFIFENNTETARHSGTITFPVFSRDSKHFAYMIMRPDGKNVIGVNGKTGSAYDKILTEPEFSYDGNYVFYGARSLQNITWVVDEISLLSNQEAVNAVTQ